MRISDWSSDVCSSDLLSISATPAYHFCHASNFTEFSSAAARMSRSLAEQGALPGESEMLDTGETPPPLEWALASARSRSRRSRTSARAVSTLVATLFDTPVCARSTKSEEHTSELQPLMRISDAVL